MTNKINIAWNTRDGDLDFLARISKKIKMQETDISSFYVCHTKAEKKKLQTEYSVTPYVLGNFLNERLLSIDADLSELIKRFEVKYNAIPLRQLAWSEMYELGETDEVLLPKLIINFEFWENFLSKNKINVIVSEGPGVLTTSVLWSICKTMGIHFVEFTPVGLPGRKNFRTTWHDSIEGLDEAIKDTIIDKESDSYREAVQYYEKMITAPEKPPYVGIDLKTGRKINEKKSYYSFPGIPAFLKVFKIYSIIKQRKISHNYYLSDSFFKKYKKWLLSFLRLKYITYFNVFEKTKSLHAENYFLFPLHILKEWCDYSWMGLKYPNISELISECAASLPFDTKLYVKEHPSLFPEKTISFYKKIKKNKNIRLISPHEDTFALIKNSKAIITLGGTTGWEAFLIGKPVVLFADNWYKNFPGIFRISNFFDLVKILQDCDNLHLPPREDKIKIIYTLLIISFEGTHYPQILMYADENIIKHAGALTKYLERLYNYNHRKKIEKIHQ